MKSIEGGIMKGWYGKYIIKKANGEPIDPHAQYFVLRIDTDPHARAALREYRDGLIRSGENDLLMADIDKVLQQYPVS